MQRSYSFDKQQFYKALSLLGLSFFLNLIPLVYAFFDSKYTSAGGHYLGIVHWIISNSEIYFLLLSTVFTSFIEYIMTIKNTVNGLIFLNVIYVILLSAVWALVELRLDLINQIMQDFNLKVFLIILVVCAVFFCLINLLLMNLRENTNNEENYRRKKII